VQGQRDYLLGPAQAKEFHPSFRPGQRLFFRLRANPTLKRNGKRLGLLTEEGQREWLDRKAGAGGFRVLSAQAVREGMVHGRKAGDDGRHDLAHLSVCFDGLLEVTEPEGLLDTLRAGVGSGKGLGFGLLSLRRLDRDCRNDADVSAMFPTPVGVNRVEVRGDLP
jgi:CRISPR system Cascade subunit CasE